MNKLYLLAYIRRNMLKCYVILILRRGRNGLKNKKWVLGTMGVLIALSILLVAMAWEPRLKVHAELTLELGDALPEPSVFFLEETSEAIYETPIDLTALGKQSLTLSVGRRTYESVLHIQDTTPPTGEVQDKEVWLGDVVSLGDFLISASDLTPVSTAFSVAPNTEIAGAQEVIIALEDTSGNITELKANLMVLSDTEAPQIHGVKDLSIFLGDNVSYRAHVSVTDNYDEAIDFEVDSTQVNLKAIGTYEILYTARDKAGNYTEEKASLTITERPVLKVTQNMVDEKAAAVIKKIIKADMSEKEKMRAVFDWAAKNVKYVGYSDKSDWLKGAYQGLTNGTGDCYNYYAVSRALLNQIGVENIPVKRIPAKTRHYWLLVKYNGDWYHFDPTPRPAGYAFECFLKSKPEVDAYTEKIWDLYSEYFNYDTTGLPEVATEPLN